MALAFASQCFAQQPNAVGLSKERGTFHVKTYQLGEQEEPGTRLHPLRVTGTLNGITYTITALNAPWNTLEAGHDYPAYVEKGKLHVTSIIKKGTQGERRFEQEWDILEVAAK